MQKEVFQMFFSIHADKPVFVSTARELTRKLFEAEFGNVFDRDCPSTPSERLNWEAVCKELKLVILKNITSLKNPKEILETTSTIFMTFAAFAQALDFYFRCGFSLDEYWDMEIDREHRLVIEEQSTTLKWPEDSFFLIFHMGLSQICQEAFPPSFLTGPLTLHELITWCLGEHVVQLLKLLKQYDSSDRYKLAARELAFTGSILMGLAKR